MRHHANHSLTSRSLWEAKFAEGFPRLDRMVRFFIMVGFYSAIAGVIVWSCIVILWTLVTVVGGVAPPTTNHYI